MDDQVTVVSVARRVALMAAMGVFVSMVDRAGFGPATFRFLGLSTLRTGRSSASDEHTRLNYRPNTSSELTLYTR